MSSSDDDDLKLAMALSLQQSPAAAAGHTEAIDLTSDNEDEDDDEDVRRAIALSLSDGKADDVRPPINAAQATPSTTGTAAGLMGLDRKAMEQERLARLGKRKRDQSPERPSKQVTKSSAVPSSSKSLTLQYPKGAIKRTFATEHSRTDDITIDEVLEASKVNIAVISSFMFDAEWLFKKLDPRKVKQIWIMNAKGKDVQERWVQDMQNMGVPNLRIHFPPMGGVQSMHSKFMLLFGKEKLRIVMPTANMNHIEWGEVANNWQPGVMENSVFLIDLPRRSDSNVSAKEDMPSFERELLYFLEKQEVGDKVTEGVLKFDFSQTAHLRFIHSIGGSHKTESDRPTGLHGLAQAIQELKLDDVEDVELDYAAASLGAVNDTFLQRIYHAARGESLTTSTSISNVRDHIRIYFPTQDTVEESHGGPACGGIISLSKQYYDASTFPKDCLRDHVSTRRGMLSHNKLLFVRGRKRDGKPFAWVYVGSANISESAWGGQRVLKSGKPGTLTIRNWECGVIMPVPDNKLEHLKLTKGEVPPIDVFEGTIEVPFKFPGRKYDGKQPWFRMVG